MSEFKNVAMKYLWDDHDQFEIVGKPALVLNHMQRGLAGEGLFIPNWGPHAAQGIKESGMVEKCRELADAFRAKGLPVIFCNAIPKPLPYMPAYGDLPKEQDAAFPEARMYNPVTDEFARRGCEVMPEMGYNPDTDYIVYNWHVHPFTCSGLEKLCHVLGVDTIVWGGFAMNSVVYTSCVVAQDYWLNNIVAVDSSYICVQLSKKSWTPEIDDIVAHAVVGVMMQDTARVTDTATVIKKLDNVTKFEEPDHRTFRNVGRQVDEKNLL
ncbi:MAG: cysteine hydrolase [Lachnospiraceae bacterium]|nr:cysteine hydrolase [Lachnospiraceae bacterium]